MPAGERYRGRRADRRHQRRCRKNACRSRVPLIPQFGLYSRFWSDWLFFGPLFVAGSIGALLGQSWGYVLFGAAGACNVYINIILRFTEKGYVYPTRGPLRYFTYFWGFFV